jgi:hypothetical protein
MWKLIDIILEVCPIIGTTLFFAYAVGIKTTILGYSIAFGVSFLIGLIVWLIFGDDK